MNKKSGFLGLSGVSSDCRDLWAAANEGNERAKLTLEIAAYQIKKFIGSYAAAMGGVDAVVNADCTILLQKPKVAPYIIPMRECLAGVLGVEVDRISVKATTTEGAGFVGREEAIAVYATVLLEKK